MPAEGRRTPGGSRLILALVIGLVGAIFLLQGLGVPLGRGFMVGDPTWAVIGLVVMAGAGAVAWREIRSRRRAP